MKKDPNVFLGHILESVIDVKDYIGKLAKEEFFKDKKTQDAVIRRMEIIGEATKNLSSSFKRKYPQIKWKEISNMRNILIHEYFGIDLTIVWGTAKNDLPKLEKELQKIISKIEE